MAMTSSRPYLIRALYEWIVDNGCTPHIVVNAMAKGVEVPQQYVNKDGQIVLNIAPRAVSGLEMSNQAISFSARFGGIPTNIYVPCFAVMGVYARENGQRMMFESEPEPDQTPPDNNGGDGGRRPSLRVVK